MADEDIVQEVYEGSLVRYPPSERRVNQRERRLLEDGGLAERLLGLSDYFNPEVWRASCVELVATTVVLFMSYTAVVSISNRGGDNAHLFISLIHFPIVALVILAAAPASGGHINPCITLATMLTGHSSPVRSLLYIFAQTVGAILAALMAYRVLPDETAKNEFLGGCMLRNSDNEGIDPLSALLSEFAFTFTLLLLAYFIALDPRQSQVTGPVLAPFLVGGIVALLILVSGSLRPGYTGAAMNPARCFGAAVVINKHLLWVGHWVFWVGPLLAGVAMALVYHAVPPHHVDKYARRKDLFHKLQAILWAPKADTKRQVPPSEHVVTAHNKVHHRDPEPNTHHDHIIRELQLFTR